MAPLVADLSDADIRDLAAYYAYLARVSDTHILLPPGGRWCALARHRTVWASRGEVDSKASAACLEG